MGLKVYYCPPITVLTSVDKMDTSALQRTNIPVLGTSFLNSLRGKRWTQTLGSVE